MAVHFASYSPRFPAASIAAARPAPRAAASSAPSPLHPAAERETHSQDWSSTSHRRSISLIRPGTSPAPERSDPNSVAAPLPSAADPSILDFFAATGTLPPLPA